MDTWPTLGMSTQKKDQIISYCLYAAYKTTFFIKKKDVRIYPRRGVSSWPCNEFRVLCGNFGSIRFHGQPLFSFKTSNVVFSLDVNGVCLLRDGGADRVFLTRVPTLGRFA